MHSLISTVVMLSFSALLVKLKEAINQVTVALESNAEVTVTAEFVGATVRYRHCNSDDNALH